MEDGAVSHTPLLNEIRTQLAIHGNAFWEAVEALESRYGFCDCGRPGDLVNFSAMHYGMLAMLEILVERP